MLEKFIQYLKVERRYSGHTLVAYKNDLEHFLNFTELPTEANFNSVSSRDIRQWVMELNHEGLSNRSINRKISSLRAFYKWLKKENKISLNPLAKIKGPKMEKRLPHFAKQTEMEKLEINHGQNDFESFRDRLIFELFYQTGIRLSELIELTDQQVQIGYIRVIGKRNKERQIPISNDLFELIKEYQWIRNKDGLEGNRLFVLKNGKNLYPKFV